VGSVYSERFFLEQGLTGSASITVDNGYRLIIRDISGYFGSQATAPSVTIDINGAKIFEADTPPLALTPFHWEGRAVANEGDVITVAMQNGNCDISVSGYRLSLP
jgi:hypothetical protein